jgi:hypothetical protein
MAGAGVGMLIGPRGFEADLRGAAFGAALRAATFLRAAAFGFAARVFFLAGPRRATFVFAFIFVLAFAFVTGRFFALAFFLAMSVLSSRVIAPRCESSREKVRCHLHRHAVL